MRAARKSVATALVVGLSLGLDGFGADQQEEPNAGRSVRDGVYTEAQAIRGKAIYLEQCVLCHGEDLRGDGHMTPSLVGIAFSFRWKDKNLYDYFVGMRGTMPQDAPGTLGDDKAADVVAYLLSAMGYPTGEEELLAAPEVLKQIVIEPASAT